MLRCDSDLLGTLLSPPMERALEALELSQKERQIVRLILLGRSSTEMMDALHIRLGTLRTHKRHIFAKLGIHKQSQVTTIVQAKASEQIEITGTNGVPITPSTMPVARRDH